MKPGKIIVKARLARLNYQARIGRVVTQGEAAAGMGMDAAMLSRIEKNKTNGAEWDTLARMCNYYGISICELLEYTEDDAKIRSLEDEDSPGSEDEVGTSLNTGLSSFARRRTAVPA